MVGGKASRGRLVANGTRPSRQTASGRDTGEWASDRAIGRKGERAVPSGRDGEREADQSSAQSWPARLA